MSSKKTKALLEDELQIAQRDIEFLNKRINELLDRDADLVNVINELKAKQQAPEISTVKKNRRKYYRFWNFSVELWPGAWGVLNYYRFDWQKHQPTSGVREGSLQVGPFGFSWFREPKR